MKSESKISDVIGYLELLQQHNDRAWFKANPHNFALEGTAALLVALLVVAFALLTSNILRVSPFLKKWLFGR